MSDYSGSPSDHMESQPPKRKATTAGLDGNTTGRSVKRRASKACQCCRARKVRCNVTEHGAPCTNCRLDEVECIVSESRRKKSVTYPVQHPTTPPSSIIIHSTHHEWNFPRLTCLSSFKGWIAELAICGCHASPFRSSELLTYTPQAQFQPRSCHILIFVGNGTRTTNHRQKRQLRQRMLPESLLHAMLSTAYNRSILHRRGDRRTQKAVPMSTCLTRYVSTDDNKRNPNTDKRIDQSHGHRNFSVPNISDAHRRMSVTSQINGLPTFPFTPFSNDGEKSFLSHFGQRLPSGQLPRFIKPLPAKIGPEEISYLEKKGALTVPKGTLRSEMLRAYVEFVHPYMPLLDLHDFLTVIDRSDGSKGKVSLILFQAVMFAGSAFVDMTHLRSAGYATRKEARKDFFQKTRVSLPHFLASPRRSTVRPRALPDPPMLLHVRLTCQHVKLLQSLDF
jgi:hypothetical protein